MSKSNTKTAISPAEVKANLQTMAGQVQTAIQALGSGDHKTGHKAMIDLGNTLVPTRLAFRLAHRDAVANAPKPVKQPKAPKTVAAATPTAKASKQAKPSLKERAAQLKAQQTAQARAQNAPTPASS